MEAGIIKAFVEQRDAWQDVALTKDEFSSQPLWEIYSCLTGYYEKHDEAITLEELKTLHTATLGGVHESKREKIMAAYEEVAEADITTPITLILSQWKQAVIKERLIDALDSNKLEEAEKLMGELRRLEDGENEYEAQDLGVTSLSVVEEQVPIIAKWWLPTLQEKLGGVRRGDSILVLARTNAGKTSWVCACCTSFMHQGLNVLHISMSEPETKYGLLLRYYQAEFNATEQDIKKDVEYYEDTFSDMYSGRLHTFVGGRQYVSKIKELIEETAPDVVVFDQYQKVLVPGRNSLNTQTARTEIVQSLQDLQKEFGFALMCVTQAGATAGRIVTEMDIDESKTGVPGEFAKIIGIGKDNQDVLLPDQETGRQWLTRYINIAKNKGEMGDFMVRLEPRICLWQEV